MSRALRWVGWGVVGLIGLVLALIGVGIYVVTQTQGGQETAIRLALDELRQHIDGEVTVAGIRSDGLLRGATLHGVEIRDGDGRPFVVADSVRTRYSVRDLLRGRIFLTPAEAWGPDVVVERLPHHERTNVERIFVPDPDPEPGEEGELRLVLRDVAIHDGRVEVRLPVDEDDPPAEGLLVEPFPGVEGARMHRVTFRDVQALVREADLLEPGREGERLRVEALSLVGEVMAEPFRVEGVRGDVVREGSRLEAVAEAFSLPASEAAGRFVVDWDTPDGVELAADLEVRAFDLRDFRWLDPDLPRVRGRFELAGEGWLDRGEWAVRNADLEHEGSRVRGSAGVAFAGEPVLRQVDVELDPLHLSVGEPWLEEPLPLEGRVRGALRADGPLRELHTAGVLTLEGWGPEESPVTAELDGVLHLEESFGASDLVLTVDPLDYRLVSALAPRAEGVRGRGRLHLEGSGRWAGESRFRAEATHEADDLPRSSVSVQGATWGTGEELEVDLETVLNPLSLTALANLFPDFPLSGETSGSVRLEGPLDDLRSRMVVTTPGGPLQAQARFDVRDPGSRYELAAQVRDFEMDRILVGSPEPTVLTGGFELAGSGLDPRTLQADGSLELEGSRVGGADITSASTRVTASGGRLRVEALELLGSVGTLEADGDLALADDLPPGEVNVRWHVESLGGLRPLAMGDTVIAADTLTPLEAEMLRFEGIDPDTLPGAAAVAWDGRASGEMTVRGSVERFTAGGVVSVDEAVMGEHLFESGRATFLGSGFPGADWTVEASAEVEALTTFGRSFRRAEVEGRYGADRTGRARLEVTRDEREEYRMAGGFRVDERGGEVQLEQLSLQFDEARPWLLQAPTRIGWTPEQVDVDDLRVVRAGPDRMSVHAWGYLPLEGAADFHLEVEGLPLARLAHMAQLDGELSGILDLSMEVHGTAAAPEIEGSGSVGDLVADGLRLSRVGGTLDYRDRRLSGVLEAWDVDRGSFRAEGHMPMDLAFRALDDRLLEEEMDLRIRADSLPAGVTLAFIEVLEEVEGFVDGEVRLAGTPSQPRSSGTLRLRDGSAYLEEIGLRLTGTALDLELAPDMRVQVSGETHSRGMALVEGEISLADLLDPAFDLRIEARNFQAVERRDLAARLGGTLALEGRYTQPRVHGNVRVEQGTIFLEEFQRTAEVVDLTDPAFFDVVDTTLVATRPVVAAARNPFMQNLRVDVDLTVQRDVWLRSREMNVEMGGELIVTYDRPAGEVLLVGSLQAIRGNYTAFGRHFQVREGTVEFPGTPGMNPSLDIQAVNRLRRVEGDPLEIIAVVEGTLMNPRVSLTSDAEPPIAESDLISYLIFGRPSYALGRGETSILQGAAMEGVTMGLGTLATQLGTLMAREIGLDYIAITQQQGMGLLAGQGGMAGHLADTQIELGQYLGQDVFVAVLLRPLTGLAAHSQTQLPGARLEWRFADHWIAEGFAEDRFAREGISGFGELGIRPSRVLGVSLFREWGY